MESIISCEPILAEAAQQSINIRIAHEFMCLNTNVTFIGCLTICSLDDVSHIHICVFEEELVICLFYKLFTS